MRSGFRPILMLCRQVAVTPSHRSPRSVAGLLSIDALPCPGVRGPDGFLHGERHRPPSSSGAQVVVQVKGRSAAETLKIPVAAPQAAGHHPQRNGTGQRRDADAGPRRAHDPPGRGLPERLPALPDQAARSWEAALSQGRHPSPDHASATCWSTRSDPVESDTGRWRNWPG